MRRLLVALLVAGLLSAGVGCHIMTGICDCDGHHGHVMNGSAVVDHAVHTTYGTPMSWVNGPTERIVPQPATSVANGR